MDYRFNEIITRLQITIKIISNRSAEYTQSYCGICLNCSISCVSRTYTDPEWLSHWKLCADRLYTICCRQFVQRRVCLHHRLKTNIGQHWLNIHIVTLAISFFINYSIFNNLLMEYECDHLYTWYVHHHQSNYNTFQ
jgi:hypothetical protein